MATPQNSTQADLVKNPPQAQIKKNLSPEQQRLVKLERRVSELEKKLADKNAKLNQAFADIEQIKQVCNRLWRQGLFRKTQSIPSPEQNVQPLKKTTTIAPNHGINTAKG